MDKSTQTSTEPTPIPAWKKIPFLIKVDAKFCFIEDWLNLVSVFIIMFLMFFATIEIIGRYIFNAPVPGHIEIVELNEDLINTNKLRD